MLILKRLLAWSACGDRGPSTRNAPLRPGESLAPDLCSVRETSAANSATLGSGRASQCGWPRLQQVGPRQILSPDSAGTSARRRYAAMSVTKFTANGPLVAKRYSQREMECVMSPHQRAHHTTAVSQSSPTIGTPAPARASFDYVAHQADGPRLSSPRQPIHRIPAP